MELKTDNELPLEKGRYIIVSITDQGIGISKENLQRIFYPYYSTKKEGSGLGLAASYSIVKNHNGHIKVESDLGKGTTFHIYLPASPEKGCVQEEQKIEENVVNKGRVMVMDDVEMVRETVRDMLTSIGYNVTTAADGTEAIELYKSAKELGTPFDAVIMDLTITGGMGGQEAIGKLMEIDPKVKAIVSSGYSNNPIMAKYEEYGFKGVIAKPYRARELGEILYRTINGMAA